MSLEGTFNFRFLAAFPIAGTAIPSLQGIRNVLAYFCCNQQPASLRMFLCILFSVWWRGVKAEDGVGDSGGGVRSGECVCEGGVRGLKACEMCWHISVAINSLRAYVRFCFVLWDVGWGIGRLRSCITWVDGECLLRLELAHPFLRPLLSAPVCRFAASALIWTNLREVCVKLSLHRAHTAHTPITKTSVRGICPRDAHIHCRPSCDKIKTMH